MKIYKVNYISFEGHNTEMFFCNKAEAYKWVQDNLDDLDFIAEPVLINLKSTKKRDIINFVNLYTQKA
jgi:hypothetical protein